MTFTHLKAADYVTSVWSGGTTTQVGIAPEGAVYADRTFLWRISSATVDLDVSDFTALPDYNRLIATLEGEIDVTHNDGPVIHLAPYGIHAFDGGWNTRSVGRCTDFNLMTRKGQCQGELTCLAPTQSAPVTAQLAQGSDAVIYCAEGSLQVELQGQAAALEAGESVLIRNADAAALTVAGCGKSMFAVICY